MLRCRSQWSRGLRHRSAAACLLRSWVRIPRGAWMFVCCECWMLSVRRLCDELITHPEESYRLWCVIVVWSRNLRIEEAMTCVGSQRHRGKKKICVTIMLATGHFYGIWIICAFLYKIWLIFQFRLIALSDFQKKFEDQRTFSFCDILS